jgi:hypothetical protein
MPACHLDDLAFNTTDTVFFRNAPQESCVAACVDVVRVIEGLIRQDGELALFCRDQFGTVLPEIFADPFSARLQPEVLKTRRPAVLSGVAKRMNIIFTDIPPVFESDSKLEGAVHRRQEFRLVDLEQLMKNQHGWNGRFTDTDRRYFIGLNQRYFEVLSDEF